MLRRTARRLCEAQHEVPVSGDKGYMTYAQACTIFGFQLNDKIERKEVKKRFNKLVLQYHPDHGGTSEKFQLLREAQKIMETHRHDKHEDRGVNPETGSGVNFKRRTYDDMTGTIHRQTADKPENRSFGTLDLMVFIGIVSFMSLTYLTYAWRTQAHLARSRWAMTEDKMKPAGDAAKAEHLWHPWKASQEHRDESYVIGVIQGSMKQDVLDQRQQELPYVPHPLAPPPKTNPFASQR